MRNVQRDIDETRSIGRGEVGSLHVGFVGSAMLTTLPAVFRQYRAAYPGVQFHLHESFTAKVVEGLQNGTLDAGLLRDGDPADLTGGIVATPIYSEPFVAVLPARHPRAKQKSISPAALRNEPFVYYPRSAGTHAFEKPLSLCEEHGFRPQIVQEAHNWLTILRLIGAGLGVSIAPACVRFIASPEVVCLPIHTGKHGVKLLSSIELASFAGESRPIVQRFAQMVTATAHKNWITRLNKSRSPASCSSGYTQPACTESTMRPRTTTRVSLTAMLGTPVTDAKGSVRGKLKDIAVATGADAGRVAGLVLKTRQGLQIVPSNQVMEPPAGTLELRSPSALRPLNGDENYLFLQQDLIDRQIIDIHGRKVVRVNDVDLEWLGHGSVHLLRVSEVEVGLRGAVQRVFKGLLPRHTLESLSPPFCRQGHSLAVRGRDRSRPCPPCQAEDRP